jgi:G3E family GTPase
MNRIRFVMVGGFLGAGKTTTLARLARFYQGRGQRVGLVTNDQAADLVDTDSLRAQGLAVEEVAGACFCCRFDNLVERVGKLRESQALDMILAEPVGSCTDLVATVVQPLKTLYGQDFEVAPYPVLFKPSHGLQILRGEPGFSPRAAYLFIKQLQEADAIVLNRIDELSPAQVEELASLVREQFGGVPVLRMSAKTGAGLEALTALLDQQGPFGRKLLDIDYDTYAEAEAELGWLNSTVQVRSRTALALDDLLVAVVTQLQKQLARRGAEVAHVKVIGLAAGVFGVANLIASGMRPELSIPSHTQVRELDLVINARVALDPAVLEGEVRRAVEAACSACQASPAFGKTQSFRPGRPMPTHRYATAGA